jgi:hypothetical protein
VDEERILDFGIVSYTISFQHLGEAEDVGNQILVVPNIAKLVERGSLSGKYGTTICMFVS